MRKRARTISPKMWVIGALILFGFAYAFGGSLRMAFIVVGVIVGISLAVRLTRYVIGRAR